MMYAVRRTSDRSDGADKPCDAAFKKNLARVDQCSPHSPGPGWYGTGVNHREVDGSLFRDVLGSIWVVEVDDLVQFMEAVDERLVLGASNLMDGGKPVYAIEIYDDYRE